MTRALVVCELVRRASAAYGVDPSWLVCPSCGAPVDVATNHIFARDPSPTLDDASAFVAVLHDTEMCEGIYKPACRPRNRSARSGRRACRKVGAGAETGTYRLMARKPDPKSKAGFVRSFPASMPAAEIVMKGKAKGIKVDVGYVYSVRSDAPSTAGSWRASGRRNTRRSTTWFAPFEGSVTERRERGAPGARGAAARDPRLRRLLRRRPLLRRLLVAVLHGGLVPRTPEESFQSELH
jgi:hypothetical protein